VRIVESARVVEKGAFLKSRLIVPEVPEAAFLFSRDPVPEVPTAVPEIPRGPSGEDLRRCLVKHVLLQNYSMCFRDLYEVCIFRKAYPGCYRPCAIQKTAKHRHPLTGLRERGTHDDQRSRL
jgi:hypothetical protein